MKKFTIIAECLCGCKTGRVFFEKAPSLRLAKAKFRKQNDPDFPMRILAVINGWHKWIKD